MGNSRTERLENRNKLITQGFVNLSKKKYKERTQFYSNETILEMVADKFHLGSKTIENIVFGRVKYKKQE